MVTRLLSSRFVFIYLFFFSLIALLTACGGGGGGGGSTSYPNLTYTGSTSAAVIDQTNADDFPFVVLESSSSTEDIPFAVDIKADSSDSIPDAKTIKKASGFISNIIKNNFDNNDQQVTGVATSQTGSCGGKYTYSENVTETSFSGSMTFSNFCEGGLSAYGYEFTMHGKMTFSGSYHLDAAQTPVFDSLNITIQYLKFTYNDGTTTHAEEFSGSITVTSFDATNAPVDFTLSVNYEYGNKIYKIENFTVDEAMGTISATFYHPDHGYVDITTTDPFTYDYANEQFCSGSLRITGSDGAGGAAVVDFTDYSCTTYDVCVTVNSDPQVCSLNNAWGTEPVWP